MSLIRLTLFVVLLLSVFYACNRDHMPNTDGQRLQKIIESSGDSAGYTFFHYDEQNRLIAITDSNKNGDLSKTLFQYNSQGDVVKYTQLHREDPSSMFTERSDSLLYNNLHQIVKRLFISDSYSTFNPKTTLNTYSYDAQGRLAVDTLYSDWNNEEYYFIQFTYDNSGNVVQWQQFHKTPGALRTDGSETASYTTGKNPFNSLGMILYILRGEHLMLSSDIPVEVKHFHGYSKRYTYEYNSNGLPRKAVVKRLSPGIPSTIGNMEFFYN